MILCFPYFARCAHIFLLKDMRKVEKISPTSLPVVSQSSNTSQTEDTLTISDLKLPILKV